jgi:hypothetical protein
MFEPGYLIAATPTSVTIVVASVTGAFGLWR